MNFTDAVALARRKHAGQSDKSGHPYVEHVLRVAACVEGAEAKIVAVLHDVLEDTETTVDELRALGASETVIEVLQLLTHHHDTPYLDYIAAIARHPLARAVKLADIADNTDPARLAALPAETRAQLREKYRKALALLARSNA